MKICPRCKQETDKILGTSLDPVRNVISDVYKCENKKCLQRFEVPQKQA